MHSYIFIVAFVAKRRSDSIFSFSLFSIVSCPVSLENSLSSPLPIAAAL